MTAALLRVAALSASLLVFSGCQPGVIETKSATIAPVASPPPAPAVSLDAVKQAIKEKIQTPIRSEMSISVEQLVVQTTQTPDTYSYLAFVRTADGFPPPIIGYYAESGTFLWSQQSIANRLTVSTTPSSSPKATASTIPAAR